MNSGAGSTGWLTVLGERDEVLAARLGERVEARVRAGELTARHIADVAKMNLSPTKGSLVIPTVTLERLRRLCQLWDVDLRPAREITSHRRFIGPVIVAAKRLLFPIVRFFMQDTLRQQREFNATAIALLADLANETHGGNGTHSAGGAGSHGASSTSNHGASGAERPRTGPA